MRAPALGGPRIDRAVPEPGTMTRRGQSRQSGQILPMVVITMGLLFVPPCVFVIDTGLVEASYAQLCETPQAASEDGASMIDQAAFRESGGQRVVLDPRGQPKRPASTPSRPGVCLGSSRGR